MIIALTVLFFVVSVLLMIIVLLQPGGSGGLGFLGGGSQSAFGTKTGNIMTKFTTVLAGLFLVVSFMLGFLYSRQGKIGAKELESIKETVEQLPGEAPTVGGTAEDIGVDISDTNE